MNKKSAKYFLQGVAWGWALLGVAAFITEFWRGAYFDFVLPLWLIFTIAAAAYLMAAAFKEK